MATSVQIMDTVAFVLYNLTPANLSVMADRIVALNVKNEWLIDKVTKLIHNRALNNPKYTELYAQLSAQVIKNQKSKPLVDSKKTFLTLLIPRCRYLLYSYKTPTCGINYVKCYRTHMLANCKFIGELYNQGILFDKTMRSIIDELINDTGYIQAQCLRTIMQSTRPKLAKTIQYHIRMTKIFDTLQSAEDNQFFGESKNILTNNIKDMNSKRSIHKDAKKLIGEEQPAPPESINNSKNTIITIPDVKTFCFIFLITFSCLAFFSIYL